MSAARYSFAVDQGSTLDIKLGYTTYGKPVDLTGCHLRMQVRRRATDDEALLDFDENSGLTITNAENGEIRLFRPADEMDLDFGTGCYDMKLYWPDGRVDTILSGSFKIRPAVTR